MSEHKLHQRHTSLIVAIALVLLCGSLVSYKVLWLDYRFADVLPDTQYRVALQMQMDGHNRELRVRTFAPLSDGRQQVIEQTHTAPGFHVSESLKGLNRELVFAGAAVPDGARIERTVEVRSQALRYNIDPQLAVPLAYPSSLAPQLEASASIQVDSDEIRDTLHEIGADRGPAVDRLRAIYRRTRALESRPFKGTTDALTALRLGQASCNGKSRLFVALARRSGIPARLVGGFVMRGGSKRTSHQWVEAYLAGHWVPFDPTNGHFASIPARYLALYRGDEVLFRHSSDINFDYRFVTTSRLVPSSKARNTFKLFNVWNLFERLGLSFLLLRTLLMLPIGALVVVVFRNVIGMPTFGTFLPALIAAAAGETGLGWGVLAVLLVVALTATIRGAFQRLQLLHSPSLAILLTVVAVSLLGTSLLADGLGLKKLAYVTLFPIAVMAITAERFYLSLTERGLWDALRDLGGTLVVIAACYVVMSSLALQILILAFPEILLLVLAANIYLGRWVGVRLLEYLRFRHILFGPEGT